MALFDLEDQRVGVFCELLVAEEQVIIAVDGQINHITACFLEVEEDSVHLLVESQLNGVVSLIEADLEAKLIADVDAYFDVFCEKAERSIDDLGLAALPLERSDSHLAVFPIDILEGSLDESSTVINLKNSIT